MYGIYDKGGSNDRSCHIGLSWSTIALIELSRECNALYASNLDKFVEDEKVCR